ncbi:NADP(H)-dependent alcohol dehydrogenase [Fusarium heterosporum]|uniref:NADP(H)-dependent alcohol dehydrogenase n=1 Tax=Fusarium heterosporum TaxID=42747 RepID=A0A8H5T444_FUSHE|nr:NADP(H)-dependent alcohol dehydrogenase [Fusarium heterosporum]
MVISTSTGEKVSYKVFRGDSEGKIFADNVERELENHEVFIETTHSGVCGTDKLYQGSGIVLGHEGVGIVRQAGPAVTNVKVGDRVGFGYTHQICGTCDNCCTDRDQYCRVRQIYGFSDHNNGSFSYGAVWDAKSVVHIPEGYDSADAAPLLCAGSTVFTVLTKYDVRPEQRIGVMGIGGLGHLAIKLASAMGAHVVVFSSSESKRQEAMDYGASEFLVLKSGEKAPEDFQPVKHLLLCGSANVDYSSLVPIVDTDGSIYPLTAALESTPVPLTELSLKGIRVQGSLTSSRDTLRKLLEFASRKNIKPTIMTYSLDEAGIQKALKDLKEGTVRYRAVLVKE